MEQFSALDDPRQALAAAYPLPEVLLVVVCGALAGPQNVVEIVQWARAKLTFWQRLMPLFRGVPSHDTLGDVLNALDASTFSECFVAWAESLSAAEPDIIAIDGKTSRRAKRGAAHPLHLVSAWAARQRLMLAQQATGDKSNEIKAIPLLLDKLELTGALVTTDAMGCQNDIATAIRATGGDYLLALKDNRPLLAKDVRFYFEQAPAGLNTHETCDADHGRIETRRHIVSHDVDWLFSDRRYADELRLPGAKAIAMVDAEVDRHGKNSRAQRWYLCSMPISAALFVKAARQVSRSEDHAQRLTALQNTVADCESRLARLYPAIENGIADASDPTLKDRLAALKSDRDQAQAAKERAFAELQPETRVTEDKISAFAALMRENVANGAIAFRRAYLRSVIDQVEVDDAEIRIHARRDAPERLVMGGGATPAGVPGFVRKWRTRQDSNLWPPPSEGGALSS
jgi:predicted transposase YbfD/YdcC